MRASMSLANSWVSRLQSRSVGLRPSGRRSSCALISSSEYPRRWLISTNDNRRIIDLRKRRWPDGARVDVIRPFVS